MADAGEINERTEEVEVNLPEDVLFELMMMAHHRDITLNQLCNEILREQLDRERP